MNRPSLPTTPSSQPQDCPADWPTSGLRHAIELGKDCLAAQAQRKQGIEQRASQLFPFCVGLLGAFGTLYLGKFTPFRGSSLALWLTAAALFAGTVAALYVITRSNWGYSGMEPKESLYKFAADGGELGLLRAVSSEYQQWIETNKTNLGECSV